jgi:hypothetical protein
MDYITSMYMNIKIHMCMYVCMCVCKQVCIQNCIERYTHVCMCGNSTVYVYSMGECRLGICFELIQYIYVCMYECMYECVPCRLNVCACRACLLMSCSQVGVGVVALDGCRSFCILHLLITLHLRPRAVAWTCMYACINVCM